MVEQIDDVKMKAIIKKVQKTMRLAGSGNDDEGQSALLMAQRLMAKYNLSMGDVELDSEYNINEKNIVKGDGTEFTRLQWWVKDLSRIIADNFKCYVYTTSNENRRKKIVFVGLEQDVAICKSVFDFALSSIKFFSDVYVKRNNISGDRRTTMAVKNDYIGGYLWGLNDKFKEQVERENWGLILVKDALVVQEYEKLNLKKGRATRRSSHGDLKAKQEGYNQGKQFSHGKNRIGN